MYTSITKHLRGLANIKETIRVEDILLPLIISKFPVQMQHELGKTHPNLDDTTLAELLSFIESEVQRYEFISDFTLSNNANAAGGGPAATPNPAKGSVTTLQANADNSAPSAAPPQHGGNSSSKRKPKCDYCKHTAHATRSCPRFWTADKAMRLDMVKKAGFCTRCLKRGHPVNTCSICCKSCGGPHATPLCCSGASHTTHQGATYQPNWSAQPAAAGYTGPPATQQQRQNFMSHPQSHQNSLHPTNMGTAAAASAPPPPHLGHTLPAHSGTPHDSSGYNFNEVFNNFP